MLSTLQKQTIQAIVNIFETGRVAGDYGQVTLLAGDSGQLTYGRSQATLASGNLCRLIESYCAMPGALHAVQLNPYLARLTRTDPGLNQDGNFRALLKQAGDDPVMRSAQDSFFERTYWLPAEQAAKGMGFSQALSCAVIYDSLIHGSWNAMRNETTSRHGNPARIGERNWISSYVATRRNWLATHKNTLLRKTVYRMDTFRTLTGAGNWQLALPLTAHGVRVETSSFAAAVQPAIAEPVISVDHIRVLRLTNPPMQGTDVRRLQDALTREGYAVDRDGIFDKELEYVVKQFQEEYGIVADGVVGTVSRMILRLEEDRL